jgi:hypothetical protein
VLILGNVTLAHMKITSWLLLALTILSLNGCATVYYVDKNTLSQELDYQNETVYVTNPEHPAYQVLKDSGIYKLTQDAQWPNKLTLDYYQAQGGCGLGMLATVYTLGVVPDSGQTTYDLSYTLATPQSSHSYVHRISYSRSTSLWNSVALPFAKTEAEIQAKALRNSERRINAPLAPAL